MGVWWLARTLDDVSEFLLAGLLLLLLLSLSPLMMRQQTYKPIIRRANSCMQCICDIYRCVMWCCWIAPIRMPRTQCDIGLSLVHAWTHLSHTQLLVLSWNCVCALDLRIRREREMTPITTTLYYDTSMPTIPTFEQPNETGCAGEGHALVAIRIVSAWRRRLVTRPCTLARTAVVTRRRARHY